MYVHVCVCACERARCIFSKCDTYSSKYPKTKDGDRFGTLSDWAPREYDFLYQVGEKVSEKEAWVSESDCRPKGKDAINNSSLRLAMSPHASFGR
jgi:hypothetical protein